MEGLINPVCNIVCDIRGGMTPENPSLCFTFNPNDFMCVFLRHSISICTQKKSHFFGNFCLALDGDLCGNKTSV
jgi:hypothetical protein